MTRKYTEDAPSTAAIAGHPLHPMVIPFPIAFLSAVILTDLGYQNTSDPFWARASWWLLAAGLVTGVAAAALGAVDFLTIRRARSVAAGWVHAAGNAAALALAGVNLWLRRGDPAEPIVWTGLVLSAVVLVLLLVTGWAGGELSYRYKVGVQNPGGARADH